MLEYGHDDYNESFYSSHTDRSLRSATETLPLLYRFYQPKSVIDFGCGQGAWLSAAKTLGSHKLTGLDGSWVKTEQFLHEGINFVPVDFEEAIEVQERYDLCISVEVAEHISEARAQSFIGSLCRASDVVLFSAAIKHQGGNSHVNEQWQSYWIRLFREEGYECVDLLRAELWDNENVEWWYRQNLLVFINSPSEVLDIEELKRQQKLVLNVVHPEHYEEKVRQFYQLVGQVKEPSLRFCLGSLRRYVRKQARRVGARIAGTKQASGQAAGEIAIAASN